MIETKALQLQLLLQLVTVIANLCIAHQALSLGNSLFAKLKTGWNSRSVAVHKFYVWVTLENHCFKTMSYYTNCMFGNVHVVDCYLPVSCDVENESIFDWSIIGLVSSY